MNIGRAIKIAFKERKITLREVAGLRGTSCQSLNRSLRNKGPQLSSILEILELIDYELVIQPKEKGVRPEGQIGISLVDYETGKPISR